MVGNAKFDLDLAKGQIGEKALADILATAKVEVKTEFTHWKKTGNIAIEVEYRGKPSGINKTESDYWCHILYDEEKSEPCMMFLFKVEKLKEIVAYWEEKHGTRNGGDAFKSKMVLVPISGIADTFRMGN